MTCKPQVVPFENRHLDQVADLMRECDRAECLASDGLTPSQALLRSVAASTYLKTFTAGGEAFAILGVGAPNLFSYAGSPWLLGTDDIQLHYRWFLRETRNQVRIMLGRHQFLENWVDSRNITSIKWLEWLGFTLGDPRPYGVAGLPFRHFEMRG